MSVFTIDNSPTDQIPPLEGRPFPDISSLHIEADDINSLLYNLNTQKAHGPDDISARFLKEVSQYIAPALALIYNVSLHQGKLPIDWKNAERITN